MKYCHHCGAEVAEDHQFCAGCGQTLQGPPAPPAKLQVRDHGLHVRLLAVLLLVWGGLGLLRAVGMMFLAGPMWGFLEGFLGRDLPGHFLPHLMLSLGWIFLAVSAAALAAGVGLLSYEPWARPLTVVVCVLALLRFPLGTLLGAYGLWVLVSGEGERHYRHAAAQRG